MSVTLTFTVTVTLDAPEEADVTFAASRLREVMEDELDGIDAIDSFRISLTGIER